MAGHERPGRDDELAEIQRLYAQLMLIRFTGGRNREPAAYQALVLKIRAVVDARTKIRGDEMELVADACVTGRPRQDE